MDESEELIRLCVRSLVAQMADVPGVELNITGNCILGLTGEPSADFNMLILGAGPETERFLVQSVSRARERGLPLTAMTGPKMTQLLSPLATSLGLKTVGTAPLMVLRAGTPVVQVRPMVVTRALGAEHVGIAGDLAAAAFNSPRGNIARCIDVGLTETSGVETWIGWSDEGPVSAVSVTRSGNTAGISLMATPPAHQRKGMGRALLTDVVNSYRGRGVERFHLTATNAGLPLYLSLGFEVIAHLSAWVLEQPGEIQV